MGKAWGVRQIPLVGTTCSWRTQTHLDATFGIATILEMPRKVRQLIADLEQAGFVDRGGKGSHRNFVHPKGPRVTVSGNPGSDAHHYQEKQVRLRIEESQR